MKQEDLKNKMDDLYNDFDRDVLWSKIEGKKKKRRPLAWWLGMLGITIFASVLMYCIYGKEPQITLARPNANVESTMVNKGENSSSNAELNAEKSTSKLELAASKNVNDSVTNSTSPVAENFNETNLNHKNETIKAKQSTNKKLSPLNNADRNLQTSQRSLPSLLDDIDDNMNTSDRSTKKVMALDDAPFMSPQEDFAEVSTATKNNTQHNKEDEVLLASICIPSISTKYSTIASNSQKVIIHLTLASIPNRDKQEVKNNILKLCFGVGYDNHQFSNTDFGQNRQSLERNLESRSIGLSYAKMFGRFSAETSIYGIQSQTQVNKIEKDNFWKYTTNNSIVEGWSGNTYKLYNEYRRLDVHLAFNYNMNLNKTIHIAPTLGIGYNLLLKQSGNIFDENNSLVDLTERKEYASSNGVFVLYGLKLSTQLKDNLVLDVFFNRQSKRELLISGYNEYRHAIVPSSFIIGLGRQF